MCGRFARYSSFETLTRLFSVDAVRFEAGPDYNTAPSQKIAVVLDWKGRRVLAGLQWGLVPPFAKDASLGARMINARSETAPHKPSFRRAWHQQRCLIPADGFYEWERAPGGEKQPWFFYARDEAPFGFAGLWESWTPPQGRDAATGGGAPGKDEQPPSGEKPFFTCTILTLEAEGLVRGVHHRMPAALTPKHFDAWLDPGLQYPESVSSLLNSGVMRNFSGRKVSVRVNSIRNNGPECVQAIQ